MINIIQVLFRSHTAAILFPLCNRFNSANCLNQLFAPWIYKPLDVKFPENYFIFKLYLKVKLKLNS